VWDVVRPGDEEFCEALESALTIVRHAYDTHRGGRKARDLAKRENLLASELKKIYVWLALLPVVGGAALLVRGEPKVNIHGVALVFAANFLRAVKVFCKRTCSKAVRRQD
jgi:hypothetical protein